MDIGVILMIPLCHVFYAHGYGGPEGGKKLGCLLTRGWVFICSWAEFMIDGIW